MIKYALLAGIALFAMSSVPSALASEDAPSVTVYKSAYCGCCEDWMKALMEAGIAVKFHDVEDVEPTKIEAGVPEDLYSCHTAFLDVGQNYVLEGHVPLEAIQRLIEEKPAIHGVAVAGMPSGSLGMGGELEPHSVQSFMKDGTIHPMPFMMVSE